MNRQFIEVEINRLDELRRAVINHELRITRIYQDTKSELRSMRMDYSKQIDYLKDLLQEGREYEFSGFLGE